MPTDPSRRPLKSRNTALASRVAQALARSSVTPNQISICSCGFAALAGVAFWASSGLADPARSVCLILAGFGIQLRLLCNLLDGMVAIEGGKHSPTGVFWNEAPDRLADIVILVGLGLAAGNVTLGWAAATMAVLTAYVRELGTQAGCPPNFSGPMAKPHRMAAATIAAVLAIPAGAIELSVDVLDIALWVICLGAFVTALRRGRAILSHLSS